MKRFFAISVCVLLAICLITTTVFIAVFIATGSFFNIEEIRLFTKKITARLNAYRSRTSS